MIKYNEDEEKKEETLEEIINEAQVEDMLDSVNDENIMQNKKDEQIEEQKEDKTEVELIAEEKKDEEKLNKTDEKNLEENEKVENKGKNHKKIKMILILSIVLLFIIGILSTGFALLNVNNINIMPGTKIKNIDLKGLTREEAVKTLNLELTKQLEMQIKLKTEGSEIDLIPSQIEAKYDIETAVENAYNIGRGKNIFVNNLEIVSSMLFGKNIDIEIKYNEQLLKDLISDITTKIPGALIQSGYYIEDDKLIITKGVEGNGIDLENAKEVIINQIKNNDTSDVVLNIVKTKPGEIDIEKIYNEVCKEPQNAYYTKDPFEVFPHVNGIKFDLEKAKEIIKEDATEYEIPLVITIPEITTNNMGTEAFPDLLSSFTTKYDASNTGRTKNLKLAADKINGTVILSGETFSYNKTVGERTIAKGYQEALGYVAGQVSPTLGGGICQISSTLYDAAVYADMQILERRNHMFLTSYTTAGRDATVVYGSIDFRFKNNRKYPIMIKASVQNGVAKMSIYGIKEEVEYEIEIATTVLSTSSFTVIYQDDPTLAPGEEVKKQGGMNGCKSITYKIKKLNGVEVSREVLSNDTYNAMNKIIRRGVAVETPEVPVEPDPVVIDPVIIDPDPEPITDPIPDPDPDPYPDPDPDPDPILDPIPDPDPEP